MTFRRSQRKPEHRRQLYRRALTRQREIAAHQRPLGESSGPKLPQSCRTHVMASTILFILPFIRPRRTFSIFVSGFLLIWEKYAKAWSPFFSLCDIEDDAPFLSRSSSSWMTGAIPPSSYRLRARVVLQRDSAAVGHTPSPVISPGTRRRRVIHGSSLCPGPRPVATGQRPTRRPNDRWPLSLLARMPSESCSRFAFIISLLSSRLF